MSLFCQTVNQHCTWSRYTCQWLNGLYRVLLSRIARHLNRLVFFKACTHIFHRLSLSLGLVLFPLFSFCFATDLSAAADDKDEKDNEEPQCNPFSPCSNASTDVPLSVEVCVRAFWFSCLHIIFRLVSLLSASTMCCLSNPSFFRLTFGLFYLVYSSFHELIPKIN